MSSILYRLTSVLSCIGVFFSLISIVDQAKHPSIFGLLFLYMPFLWILWVCCVIFIRRERNLLHLLGLWCVIDIAILMLFLSFSMGTDDWTKGNGADLVLLVTYFPVLIPTNFLISFLMDSYQLSFSQNFDVLLKLFGNRIGEGFACWLSFSLLSIPQSLFLIAFSQILIFMKKKEKNVENFLKVKDK